MFYYLFGILLLLHGLIHLMGFAKAFNYGHIQQLTKEITKASGILWLITSLLFITLIILYLLDHQSWPYVAITTVVVSQVLIFSAWKDARYGSAVNFIILLAAIAGLANDRFESTFRKDVQLHLQQSNVVKTDKLTETDILSLPEPIQKYLRYSGVINKPKVYNMRVVFEGQMRDKGKNWFTFRSLQYNFFDDPARLFYMKAKIFGLTVPGYHDYQNNTANMQVKLFGLFPLMKAKGIALDKAETVTVFNDMCLLAPATLIDKRILWEAVDSLSAKAIFTNGNIRIAAMLYFNKNGELVNFISDDRYAISDMKQYRFSTPVKNYRPINGTNIMHYGEVKWHYPDGEFVYGKFYLKEIAYNVN